MARDGWQSTPTHAQPTNADQFAGVTTADLCHTSLCLPLKAAVAMRDELWPGFETLIPSRTREWEGPWTSVGGRGSD